MTSTRKTTNVEAVQDDFACTLKTSVHKIAAVCGISETTCSKKTQVFFFKIVHITDINIII